uniref:Inverse autotransporter beta-domain domain-containing protein n=1 Tax=Oscillatoriales cyanobacterium SpSt-418 TaxID=2282169 RepID=A0A7C3KD41_9CYAN
MNILIIIKIECMNMYWLIHLSVFMPAKQFTHTTVCATGILLIELVASKASQSTGLPSILPDNSISTTLASSRDELASTDHKPFSKPAHIAEPERLNEFEFPLPSSASDVVTSHSNLVETGSTHSGVLASVTVPSSQTIQSIPDSQPVNPIKQHEAIAIVSKPETIAISPKSLSNSTAPISIQVKGVIASTRANDLIPLSAPTLASSGSSGAFKEIDQVPLSNAVNSTPPTILPRAGVEFTAGDTIGNPNSLGGINGFIPLAQTPGRNITFAEGRVRLSTNNANPSTNLVLGHRIYDPKSDRIFGGYLAFDYRNTGNNGFNQLGFGVEALGKTWDVRANVYLPLGNNRQLASESVNRSAIASTEPFFQQNFLATTRTIQEQINQQFEAAVGGFDVEAGGKLAKLGSSGELRGYGGIYYLKAPESDSAVGVRGRLEARITDNVQAGLVVSHDGMFGTNVALTVGFTMPTTRPRRSTLKEPFLARLGDSVNRNSTIAIQEQRESRTVITQATQFVTNPATGQPWRFRHANLGTGIGDGTFENPTGTVAEALAVAQPDDIVYVQPGTNPGIPTFTIPDRVQVLSTGPVQRNELPRRKQRGIRIKKEPIVHPGGVGDIHCPAASRISQSSFHPHAYRPYSQSNHHSRTRRPTTAFLPLDIA